CAAEQIQLSLQLRDAFELHLLVVSKTVDDGAPLVEDRYHAIELGACHVDSPAHGDQLRASEAAALDLFHHTGTTGIVVLESPTVNSKARSMECCCMTHAPPENAGRCGYLILGSRRPR